MVFRLLKKVFLLVGIEVVLGMFIVELNVVVINIL